MEGLSLSITTTISSTSGNACGFRLRVPSFSNFRNCRTNISVLHRKPRNNLLVFAASGKESELRKWVSMELEWGNLIGEDPELTLAKIVGRRSYPGMTDMELQKLYEKEGKAAFPELDKLPFDLSEIRKKPSVKGKTGSSGKNEVPSNVSEIKGLKLERPVPKKGFEYEINYKPRVIKRRTQPVVKTEDKPQPTGPTITLRKPTSFFDDNTDTDKSLELSEEWGSSLEVSERQRRERVYDQKLVRKPDPYILEKSKEEAPIGPSITLRKPTSFFDDNIGTEKSLELSEKWDSSLEMSERQSKERFIDSKLVRKPDPYITENSKEIPVVETVNESQTSGSSITLRTPTSFYDDNIQTDKSLDLSEKRDSLLEMSERRSNERLIDSKLVRKPDSYILENVEEVSQESQTVVENCIEENERISLSQKPEIVNIDLNDDQKLENSRNKSIQSGSSTIVPLLQKPEIVNLDLNAEPKQEDSGGQRQSNSGVSMETVNARNINIDQSIESDDTLLLQDYSASLLGQPKRLDRSAKQELTKSGEGGILVNPESSSNTVEHENFAAKPPIKEHEDRDWARAEDLIKVGGREEVELISVSSGGFVVSFGSLVGFLPYRNVATRWRYLAYEPWLRKKGLDPSNYKQNLGIGDEYEATNLNTSLDSSVNLNAVNGAEVGCETSSDMKFDDLIVIYNQEKLKYFSSFVGQRKKYEGHFGTEKFKVYVVLADRESRKLIFSAKQKEKEESIEKRKKLMAKLSVGDVVKCRVTKITYFGIFVGVEGVSALVHQTEVSWDDTLDLSAHFKSGQVIEAKVIQLDFSRGHIFLSLKEITPDPLIETLESGLFDQASLEAVEADTEWTEVDLLVKELEQYEGIESVSKGQYFQSPGLAPTFQVYMASMFEDKYKLLARSENKVQEVLVKSSLSKEEMKNAILTCTNRVK